MPSIVRMPSLALSRSVQNSVRRSVVSHIEPVLSSAITMSTGVDEHGLQALECALTLKWSMPKSLAKNVFVLADPGTVSSLGLTDAWHQVAATAVAVETGCVVDGRSCAPASAAEWVAACSCRLA